MPSTQNGKHPLLIIDCYGFVYRAYHANPKLTNPEGQEVGAIYGFTNMLIKILARFNPRKVIAIFDDGGLNFRHKLYKEYKQNRPPAPEDLKSQFPYLKDVTKALNITTYSQGGYEADDVIASIAKKFCTTENVVIFSSDKDLLQLVDNQILIFNPSSESLVGAKEVREKFGVDPTKMKDYLALVGDASDNVPGIKGIGAKSAVSLLEKFSSLNDILNNVEHLSERQKTLFIEGKESGILSLELVTLVSNLHIPFESEDLDWNPPHRDHIMNFLEKHNFQSLIKRANKLYDTKSLYQEAQNSFNKDTKNDESLQTYVITTLTQLKMHLDKSLYCGYLSFFIEKKSNLRIYCSNSLEESFVINQENYTEEIANLLLEYFANQSIVKIVYDIKNIFVNCPEFVNKSTSLEDVMLMHYCLDTKNSKELTLAQILHSTIGKVQNTNSTNLVCLMQKAFRILREKLFLTHTLFLYQEFDLPLAKILYNMESTGILVDQNKLEKISKSLSINAQNLETTIFKFCGTSFNLSSPKQLADVLFNVLAIPHGRKLSKSQTYSTDVTALEEIEKSGFPIARLILEWRHINKLKTTYADALQKQINPKTKRIHTTFSQHSTQTGRLSSTNPNLQNIPIKSKPEEDIRSAFIAAKGYKIVSVDYSQIELRILSHVAQIVSMQNAFIQEEDVHLRTAAEIFKLPLDALSEEHRNRAKTINFGIIYGSTNFGIAKQLGISHKEAQKYIDSYFEQYPEILQYMNNTKHTAHSKGYVSSIFGRRCSIENINHSNHVLRSAAERAAINAPIQATASDIVRLAMVDITKIIETQSLPCRLLLQIHDELIFECEENIVDHFSAMLKINMENVVRLSVPLRVNISCHQNW
jgi:DNA polymerase-1